MFVQFSDGTETIIAMVFRGAQSPEVYPNLGEVGEDDERYLGFVQRTTVPPELADPVDKLRAFLAANPDVAAILGAA